MSLHDSIYGLGPQCNALRRLSRELRTDYPMSSAHAQQAVAVLPGAQKAQPFRIWLFGSDLVSDAQ
jgi:hypothetical protein